MAASRKTPAPASRKPAARRQSTSSGAASRSQPSGGGTALVVRVAFHHAGRYWKPGDTLTTSDEALAGRLVAARFAEPST